MGDRFAQMRERGEDGITLVELLIALLVIMVTFAALASTVIAAFSGIRSNEARVRATALANEAIEDMATMPWGTLGLSEEDQSLIDRLSADPEFDEGTDWSLDAEGNLDYALIDSELVVLLDDSPEVPTHQPEPIDRDGRLYTLERWVTFAEEEEDGAADLKRIKATVSWTQAGRNQSITTESLRAPDPSDLLDLEVTEIAAFRFGSDENRVAIYPPDHVDEFKSMDSFEVTVVVRQVEASVVLTFADRDGNTQSVTAANVAGEEKRSFLVNQDQFRFPHGPVNMLVTATGADGQVASNTTSMRFYQEVAIDPISIEVLQDGLVTNEILLDPDNECKMAGDVSLTVAIAGLTQVESASPGAALVMDYGAVDEATLGYISTTDSGGIFGVDLTGPDSEDDHEDVSRTVGPGTFTIEASRDPEGSSYLLDKGTTFNEDVFDLSVEFVVNDGAPDGACE